MDHESQFLLRSDSVFQSDYIKHFGAIKAQRGGISSFFKLTRQNAHPHQVAAMNALETLGDDRSYTQQLCSLSGPVARASGSIFLPGNHYKRHSFRLVLHRGVIDTDALAVRLMNGHTALNTGHHQVFDPYIRERATQHHLVIASA